MSVLCLHSRISCHHHHELSLLAKFGTHLSSPHQGSCFCTYVDCVLEVSLGSLYYGFYILLLLTFSLPLAVSDSGSFKGNASSPFSWLGKQCYSEREWKASVHGPLVHLRVLPAAFEFHYVPKLFCADAGKASGLGPSSVGCILSNNCIYHFGLSVFPSHGHGGHLSILARTPTSS